MFFAQAGDKEQAFAWLEKAYQRRIWAITSIDTHRTADGGARAARPCNGYCAVRNCSNRTRNVVVALAKGALGAN